MPTQKLKKNLLNSIMLESSLRSSIMFACFLKTRITGTTAIVKICDLELSNVRYVNLMTASTTNLKKNI